MRKERERMEEQKKEAASRAKNADAELDGPKEEELLPEKLARTDKPLEEAIHFLKPLQLLAPKRIETHLLAFEIYFRKGKLLLMLQSVKRGYAIDSTNPHFHECCVRFLKAVAESRDLPVNMKTVLQQEISKMFTTKTPQELNDAFLQKHHNSSPHILAGARMMYYLDNSKQDKAIALATNLSAHLHSRDLKTCSSVFENLRQGAFGRCEKSTESYKAECQRLFPLALLFRPPGLENNLDSPTTPSPDGTTGISNGATS
jgi:hypothetical protein